MTGTRIDVDQTASPALGRPTMRAIVQSEYGSADVLHL
jgi:hypothetical protein